MKTETEIREKLHAYEAVFRPSHMGEEVIASYICALRWVLSDD